MSHLNYDLIENNVEFAKPKRRSAETGMSVVMHHNDNWSPQAQVARRLLMRAATIVAIIIVVALMIAWVGFLGNSLCTFAVSMLPIIQAGGSVASRILRWIWSQA